MKSKLIKIGIAIFSLLLFTTILFFGYLITVLNCGRAIGSRVSFDKENNILSVNDNEAIRILQLSDTQICGLGDSLKSLDKIKLIIEKADPDLIVLTGDNLMNDSKRHMVRKYIRFLDSFEIPWAPVMGNHDYFTKITMEEYSSRFEGAEYCLFKTGSVSNSYGNYYYTLERNGEKNYAFVFMDNGDGFRAEHIEWYEDTINTITDSNDGEVLPSWTLFHIPLMETRTAYYSAERNGIEIDGEKREGISSLWDDAGIFDKAKELGSAKAMIYGHNHRNSFVCDYQGIKMCYGVKSSVASYHDRDLIGGCVYTLNADNTFTLNRIFV